MNQRGALKATIQMAEERGMRDNHQFPSLSLSHIKSMEARITPEFSDAKVGRWLGWAQCAVVAAGLATLDEMKTINKRYELDAGPGNCKECGAELQVNVIKMHSLQVFCPQAECVVFGASFWVDR